MQTEKKELLFPEEIIELKNWNKLEQNLNPKDLSPLVDKAFNYLLFNENKDVSIKLKTKKPTKPFTKAYIVADIGCDSIGEKFEIVVCYGKIPVYNKIFETKREIITRYKSEFKIKFSEFKFDHFTITFRILPSKNQNISNLAFTIFSLFVETVIDETLSNKNEDYEYNEKLMLMNNCGRKIYVKNFFWEKKKDLLKLTSKPKYVFYSSFNHQKDLTNIDKTKPLKISILFSLTNSTLLNNDVSARFTTDVGITTEKLFNNLVNYNEIKDFSFKSFQFNLNNYSENYEVNFALKEVSERLLKDNLIVFFSITDTENIDDFYISDIDIILKN